MAATYPRKIMKHNNICKDCAWHSYDVFARSLCNHPDKGETEVWDYCPACIKFKAKTTTS